MFNSINYFFLVVFVSSQKIKTMSSSKARNMLNETFFQKLTAKNIFFLKTYKNVRNVKKMHLAFVLSTFQWFDLVRVR